MLPNDYKIITIDDHFLIRQMVGTILKAQGIATIDGAGNGADGIEKVKKAANDGAPYHIVFLDISMPDMSGYEVLKACRDDRKLDQTAIIMLTAESEDLNIVKTLEAGATAYIPKPFKPETLVKKVEDVQGWLKARGRA